MGEVIRKNAASETIFDHARRTRTSAASRGGEIETMAGSRLDEVLQIVDFIVGEKNQASEALAPLQATVSARDNFADGEVGRIADEIWNFLGRPASDPGYSVLFPGGIKAYVDAAVEEEPLLLKLLAKLLDLPVHPKLGAEQKSRWKQEFESAGTALADAVEARRPVEAQVRLLGKVLTALGKVTQMRLASLKRDFKNLGMTEPQIHEIIPDAFKPKKSGGGGGGGEDQ